MIGAIGCIDTFGGDIGGDIGDTFGNNFYKNILNLIWG
jgi:hypothetical protein